MTLTLNSEVWSNFEIADMDFWRGEAYTAFFNYLDSHGGFYYEVRPPPSDLSFPRDRNSDTKPIQRWGDAPVHSIAAALFASKDQIHFFNEIGYEHAPYTHCPRSQETWSKGRCGCDPKHSFGKLLSIYLLFYLWILTMGWVFRLRWLFVHDQMGSADG